MSSPTGDHVKFFIAWTPKPFAESIADLSSKAISSRFDKDQWGLEWHLEKAKF